MEDLQPQQIEALYDGHKALTAIVKPLNVKNRELTEEIMTLRFDGDTKDRRIATLEQRLRDHGL